MCTLLGHSRQPVADSDGRVLRHLGIGIGIISKEREGCRRFPSQVGLHAARTLLASLDREERIGLIGSGDIVARLLEEDDGA